MMENQMMQALVWLGPRDMVQRAEPVPKPAEGEVLILVGAVGILRFRAERLPRPQQLASPTAHHGT